MKIPVVEKILEANERIAAQNRELLREYGIFSINIMSSPGAGKTTLIESTIKAAGDRFRAGVIEGDIQGTADAERIGRLGVPVTQINTGGCCHLDANMVSQAMQQLPLAEIDLLIVENVGNLVCPAEFNVGEDAKVMLLSITEGEDKPLKYPLMFQQSKVLLINKIDLNDRLEVDVEKIKKDSLSLNPSLEIFEISARTGAGMNAWTGWLNGHIQKNR